MYRAHRSIEYSRLTKVGRIDPHPISQTTSLITGSNSILIINETFKAIFIATIVGPALAKTKRSFSLRRKNRIDIQENDGIRFSNC